MPTELRLDSLRDGSRLQSEGGLREWRHHLLASEPAELSAIGAGAFIGRKLARDSGEVFATISHSSASGIGRLARRHKDVRRAHLRRALTDSRRQRFVDFLTGQRGRGHQPLIVLLGEVRQGEDLIRKLGKPRLGGSPRLRWIRRGRWRRGNTLQRRGGGCPEYRSGQNRRTGNRHTGDRRSDNWRTGTWSAGHWRCHDRRRERRRKERRGGARGHGRSLGGQCRRWTGTDQWCARRREAV